MEAKTPPTAGSEAVADSTGTSRAATSARTQAIVGMFATAVGTHATAALNATLPISRNQRLFFLRKKN